MAGKSLEAAPMRIVGNKEEIMKTLIALALALGSAMAMAHSGGTDKNGCHTDHKTGTYHCH